MPTPASVLSEGTLRSSKGKVYRIIRTNEVDAGEPKPPPSAVVGVGMMAAGPVGDDFMGNDRKAAKLSISAAPKEKFNDLADLIQSLPAISAMKAHQPVITLGPTSGRVTEEERNVTLNAFLYAASREADNDFHLIVGRDPHTTPPLYLTIEVSGLPPTSSAFRARLRTARSAFKKYFGAKVPGLTYDFYDPPIPLRITGSLFFDMTHAMGKPPPGPKSLKANMPTIWEVHPITTITFEP